MTPARILIAGNAAVASEQPLASAAGCDVLRKGGNAFDAAVATSFSLAVTQHQAGGLGGDFFGMFFDAKSGIVHCLNSSGWAPSGSTLDLMRSTGEEKVPSYGALSCVVPGHVAGVWEMHKRFGGLEFGDLLAASSSYASNGFPASEGLCRSITLAFEDLTPEARCVLAPAGRPPVPGEWIRQVALGKVIEEIAQGGAEAFYCGWPSDLMRSALQDMGVPSDASDFRDFKPEWVDPLVLDYRGTAVHEAPPNSIGATSLLMLKLLSEHALSRTGPLSQERMALTVKAAETAYERKDRMLGDPRFCKIDMDAFMATPIKDKHYAGRVEGGDTTAFSVVDREGNLVSGIQSLFHQFGSRVFVPGCGIMLNNRGSGFRFEGPNKVEPRKRPLHTLSSLILERGGTDHVAIGTSGGEHRPIQHTLLITNIVDYQMTLEQAVQHPRFLWSGGSDLIVEAGWQVPTPPGYKVQRTPTPGTTGVCQAVELHGGTRKAVCDGRGDGFPAGF